jgi:glucosamine-6-phosphate deaminase
MEVHIADTREANGRAAAATGAQRIRESISTTGEATILVATGTSQFEMLNALTSEPDIDWGRVTVFHLDEYVGIPESHPASFRGYLKKRFAQRVPELAAFHYVQGDAADPQLECRRLNSLIRERRISVGFIGIGENGHLAFNDPPADFQTTDPYIVVTLDLACRRQQMGEGWFESVEQVPEKAISMSVSQILRSEMLVVTVPDERKSEAVRCAVEGPVDPRCPASALQEHDTCQLFLDAPAASKLASEAT